MLGQILPELVTATLGTGLFLRLVAKEKHRRERYLQFRLDEQIRKMNEEKEMARKKAEEARQQAERVKQEAERAAEAVAQERFPSAGYPGEDSGASGQT